MIDKPLYLSDLIRKQGGNPTKHTIQRTRRFLKRAEERLGIKLLIQEYPGGPSYTTLTLLYRWMPELFPDDYKIEVQRDEHEIMKRDIAILQGNQIAIKQRVKSLAAEVRQIKATPQTASDGFTKNSSL